MTKYDKELDSSRPEFDEAIEPLERETHEVPPPRDHQGEDDDREENRDRQ